MLFRPAFAVFLLLAAPAFAQSGTQSGPPRSASTKPANDPTFRLINAGDKAVTEVFATPAGRSNWGKNRLDKGTLPAQGAHVFTLPRDGNCIYDLKVVFIDGKSRQRKAVNLCKLSDLPVK